MSLINRLRVWWKFRKVVRGNYNDIHPDAEIGEGSVIWSWNRIGKSKIGKNCKIANWCTIDNGVIIGDGCNIQGHVDINDNSRVGDRVFMAGGVRFTDIRYPTIEFVP